MGLDWPPRQVVLDDGVVQLRGWVDADADAVLAACQDAEIQARTRIPVPYGRDDAVGLVRHYAPQVWADRTGASFAVVMHDAPDAVVGSCGLVAVDPENLVGAVGYWTAQWARNRGVATRAVRLLCSWAVTGGGLDRLELTIEPDNAASRSVAERAGCVAEGVMRRNAMLRGARRDLVLYAYLR